MKRAAVALAVVLLAGCKGHEFHPPDRAGQVAQADSLYPRALFDTVTWGNDAERLQAGNEVYARKCDKCHGPTGEAGTAYAAERNLKVPALAASTLPFDAVRHRVFAGHVNGMPTWGVSDLAVREIDAVAAYVSSPALRKADGTAETQ